MVTLKIKVTKRNKENTDFQHDIINTIIITNNLSSITVTIY